MASAPVLAESSCAKMSAADLLEVYRQAKTPDTYAETEACLRSGLQRHGENRDVIYALARIVAFQKRFKEAKQLVIESGKGTGAAQETLGDIAWYAGDLKTAKRHYKSAWKLSSKASRPPIRDKLDRIAQSVATKNAVEPTLLAQLEYRRYEQSQNQEIRSSRIDLGRKSTSIDVVVHGEEIERDFGALHLTDQRAGVSAHMMPVGRLFGSLTVERAIVSQFTSERLIRGQVGFKLGEDLSSEVALGVRQIKFARDLVWTTDMTYGISFGIQKLEAIVGKGIGTSESSSAAIRHFSFFPHVTTLVWLAGGRDEASRPYLTGAESSVFRTGGGRVALNSFSWGNPFFIAERRTEDEFQHTLLGIGVTWSY